jgi:hypothetical protein
VRKETTVPEPTSSDEENSDNMLSMREGESGEDDLYEEEPEDEEVIMEREY